MPGLTDIDTIEQRLQIAREFKAATGGAYEVDDATLDGEKSGVYVATKRAEPTKAEKRAAEKRARESEARKIREASIRQAAKGKRANPTYGIYPKGKRFLANTGGASGGFDCAIDAAAHRNKVMGLKYPGVDAFQVDLEAVWSRFGCACGKHERGSK